MTASTRRLLVTRPAAQTAPAVAELRALGIDAVALPLIGIEPLADPSPLTALWARLGDCAAAVFVSQNAVEHFFAARPDGPAWPSGTLAAAPGPGTAAALRAAGVPAECVAEPAAGARQDSESLWAALSPLREWQGAQVLILRGDDAAATPSDAGVGREWLAATLAAAGAEVQLQAVYRRGAARLDASQLALLRAALSEPAHHAWLFASAEAVDHLRAIAAVVGLDWPAHPGAAIATHPRIAERARAVGFAPVHAGAADAASVARDLHGLGSAADAA